jgi:drug/metabolite transporter (DMT)-like permease
VTARQLAALLFLGAAWGGSFLFIRMAAPVLGPLPLMAGRVLLAAGALWLIGRLRRMPIPLRPYWKQLLLLGLIHAAAPFALIAFAETHLTASMTAVLVAAQPLLAALIGGLWLDEAIPRRHAVGFLIGLAGVGVLVGWSPGAFDRSVAWSIGATLIAAMCYATGSIYAKRRLAGAPLLTLALGQQLGAAAWLVVPAAFALPHASIAAGAVGALLGLALVSTALAYLAFFWLLGQVGVIKTATVTYIIPVFGVVWGTLLLHEPLTTGIVAGLASILLSLLLVNNVQFPRPLARRFAANAQCPATPRRSAA